MTNQEARQAIAADTSLTNRQRFELTLTEHYRDLFETPEFAMVAKRMSPAALAEKMTDGLIAGSADKGGDGVKRTCRDLGIAHTYTAIRAYLT